MSKLGAWSCLVSNEFAFFIRRNINPYKIAKLTQTIKFLRKISVCKTLPFSVRSEMLIRTKLQN